MHLKNLKKKIYYFCKFYAFCLITNGFSNSLNKGNTGGL